MNIKLYRSEIDGEVIAPLSKSVTHRALILAALAKGESRLEKILVADDTLCTIAALEALGVKIHGGKILGGKVRVPGSISSQYISALLLISPFAQTEMTIETVDQLRSTPYVALTIDLMKEFGVQVRNQSFQSLTTPKSQHYRARDYRVEGDYPDIVQTLAVVAANASGVTQMKNIKHLRYKETNRIKAIVQELSKMGAKVETDYESLKIEGNRGKGLQGSEIETYNDHRMAMSFAVAGLVADGSTIINNAEVVKKSYPDYFDDLRQIGARFEVLT